MKVIIEGSRDVTRMREPHLSTMESSDMADKHKKIPISVAREVARRTNTRQVILLAWDGRFTHIVTYGKTTEDCAQAAEGGNILKKRWGWPETNDQPSRVVKLQQMFLAMSQYVSHNPGCSQGIELTGCSCGLDKLLERIAADLGYNLGGSLPK